MFCLDTGVPGADRGHATETILFVHGFPLDHTMWRAQWSELSQTHRCLAPDLRGFGASSVTSGTVTMAQFADDLDELLTQLSISSPVTVCGLSMGGYIAFELWHRHPARVGRLVLCDTKAEADSAEVACGREMMAQQVERDGMAGVVDGMLPKLISPETISQKTDTVAAIRRVVDNGNPQGVAAAQRGMAARDDFRDRLSRISVPTLVLCGEHDTITPLAGMRALAETMPNGDFAEIRSAGHLAPMEQPDLVCAAIRRWLEADGAIDK